MRWFVGYHGRARRAPALVVPTLARELWDDGDPLWVAGDWRPDEVRVVRGTYRAAVLGICLVDDRTLAEDLSAAVGTGDYEPLARWPGSYNVVVQDHRGTRILTDLAGQRPVFAMPWDGGTLYASMARPLAALSGAAPDPGWLAAVLMCPGLPEARGDRSPFIGVRKVPPGTWLRISDSGTGQSPGELPHPGTRRLSDGADALREGLEAAVAGRVRAAERPTSDLSGGLDSSTVTLLAARHLRGPELPALTRVDNDVPGDDPSYAVIAAAHEPRLRLVLVVAETGMLPFQGMVDTPVVDEPTVVSVQYAFQRRCLDAVAGMGSDLHLTGDGGDAVLLGPPAYLADLARLGRVPALVRHAAGWARLRQRSPLRLARAAVRLARTDYRGALSSLATLLTADDVPTELPPGGLEQTLAWYRLSEAWTWCTPEARAAVASRLRDAADEPPSTHRWSGDLGALRSVQYLGSVHRTFAQVAERVGVRVAAPFLDDHVVRACLSVRAAERTSPFTPKPLLSAAFRGRGLLPEQILARRTKDDFTSAHLRGVAEAGDDLLDMLRGSRLAALGVVEPHRVLAAVRRAAQGFPDELAGLGTLVAAETWLHGLVQEHARWWSPRGLPSPREEEPHAVRF